MVDVDSHEPREVHVFLLAPGPFLHLPRLFVLHIALIVAAGAEVDERVLTFLVVGKEQQLLLVGLIEEPLPHLLGHVLAEFHEPLGEPFRHHGRILFCILQGQTAAVCQQFCLTVGGQGPESFLRAGLRIDDLFLLLITDSHSPLVIG